jgi:hypothetical protein
MNNNDKKYVEYIYFDNDKNEWCVKKIPKDKNGRSKQTSQRDKK